jgi:hypothetical protein
MTTTSNTDFDREKWEVEKSFKEREFSLKEHEQKLREAELELKKKEHARSQWSNPLIVAILAASIAAFGTTAVALVNGFYARRVESQRAEEARILEIIRTGDADKAAETITFLLQAGLIKDNSTRENLTAFLNFRKSKNDPSPSTSQNSEPTKERINQIKKYYQYDEKTEMAFRNFVKELDNYRLTSNINATPSPGKASH